MNKLICVPVSVATREHFKAQVARRAAASGRFLSVAQAVREALVAAGYDLSDPERQGRQDQQATEPRLQ